MTEEEHITTAIIELNELVEELYSDGVPKDAIFSLFLTLTTRIGIQYFGRNQTKKCLGEMARVGVSRMSKSDDEVKP
jgi:hypothetical protein